MTSGHHRRAPQVCDAAAWKQFRLLAHSAGLDPDDRWVGGYVSYEWNHARHFFDAYVHELDSSRVLEFGCNVGASSVVLAALGANVIAVDTDARFVDLARAQISAYGLNGLVNVIHLDGAVHELPFGDSSFDVIVCNSVLEYVDWACLAIVQKELLRVLSPGGLILVLSTSNRLWPKEVHSGKWLSNYVPRKVDRLCRKSLQRGVSPFKIRAGFSGCVLVDKEDNSGAYLAARAHMGTSASLIAAMRLVSTILRPFRVTVGMLMPSFALVLRRQAA